MQHKALLLLAVTFALLYGAYSLANPTSTYRFMLTAEIDTPVGIRSGSGAYEVEVQSIKWGTIESRGIRRKLRGDAIFIDLGRGDHVILAMTTGEQGVQPNKFTRIARDALAVSGRVVEPAQMRKQKAAIRLPPSLHPTFVHFRDVRDPFSGAVIKPDHFEDTFGRGVRLRRVVLTMTDARVGTGIEGKLPFLHSHREQISNLYQTYPPVFMPHAQYFVRR